METIERVSPTQPKQKDHTDFNTQNENIKELASISFCPKTLIHRLRLLTGWLEFHFLFYKEYFGLQFYRLVLG